MSYVDNDRALTERAWFRPAVGLWFGMLVGAGTLGVLYVTPEATRDALFEQAGLTGLHRFFEPPVGMAGFAAVAVAAGLVGFLFGLAIAARLARRAAPTDVIADHEDEAGPVEAEEMSADTGRRRVFSAREDIGEEGIPVTQTAETAPQVGEDEDTDEDEHLRADPEAVREPVPQAGETAASEPVAAEPAPPPVAASAPASLADLTLDQLTTRLAAALEARKAAPAAPSEAGEQTDQVISFLRREAERAPAPLAGEDPQAALRSALDKLGRVGKSD